MRLNNAVLSLTLITLLTMPEATRPGLALTSAKAVDHANAFPNVGSIMVWRDPNNPLGLPGGLAADVTGVLIHPHTILTAGHFAARAEPGVPPFSRVVVSFAPNALDQSTWIDVSRAPGTCIAHPSFPRPCTPQSCPFDDTDGLVRAGDQRRRSLLSRRARARHPASQAGQPHPRPQARPGHENDHRRLWNDGARPGRSG